MVNLDLKEITIRNFKSIKEQTIDLENFNLVIGPNGSGKTNLVDALLFLREAFKNEIPRRPWRYWWNPRNIVWEFNDDNTISYILRFDTSEYGKIVYYVVFSVKNNMFRILHEELTIEELGTSIIVEGCRILFRTEDSNIINYIRINNKLPISLSVEGVNITLSREGLYMDIVAPTIKLPPGSLIESPLILVSAIAILLIMVISSRGREDEFRILIDSITENNTLKELYTILSTAIYKHYTKSEMKSIRENMPPPNISDGFYKYLTILTALALKPSLLVIDEIENTLHVKLIEILYDIIKHSGVKVLATTHSLLLVNICDPREIILSEITKDGTLFKRISNPEEFVKELNRLGIMPSTRLLEGAGV